MSLLSNNKKDNKKSNKAANKAVGNKPVLKPGQSANISKKPVKTGGTRGS